MEAQPTNCVFGVPLVKLLGFIISNRGIEANLEKVTTITQIGPLAGIKDI